MISILTRDRRQARRLIVTIAVAAMVLLAVAACGHNSY
jgi:hypothetical protein